MIWVIWALEVIIVYNDIEGGLAERHLLVKQALEYIPVHKYTRITHTQYSSQIPSYCLEYTIDFWWIIENGKCSILFEDSGATSKSIDIFLYPPM